MMPTMRRLSAVVLISLFLGGCISQPPPTKIETTVRVDPRLLEQTDQPASESMAGRAKLYHTFSPFEESCPDFVWCRLLAHGGYSAKFISVNRLVEVTHYFDSHGHALRSEKRHYEMPRQRP